MHLSITDALTIIDEQKIKNLDLTVNLLVADDGN